MSKNKVYAVCGYICDFVKCDDGTTDINTWIAVFATEEEADEACEMVNDFYSNKCHVDCEFDVKEINLNKLCTVKTLKKDLDTEYKEWWS